MAEILDGFLANYLFAEANATVNFSSNSTRPLRPPHHTHTQTLLLPPRWVLAVLLVRVMPGALVADASFWRRFSQRPTVFTLFLTTAESTCHQSRCSIPRGSMHEICFEGRLMSAYITTVWQRSCGASQKQMTNSAPLFMELLLTCNGNSLFGSRGPCAQNNS